MENKVVLIMAGGTGGHIFPGLALAKEMLSRGYRVVWLGTESGMESTLVPRENIEIRYIPVKGVRGKGVKSLLMAPWNIVSSILAAARIIRDVKPNVVVGLGGFVAGPGGVASKLKGKALVIHEQNAIAGSTNKLLSKIADRVLTAFPAVLKRGECIGNPVRQEIEDIVEPRVRIQERDSQVRLLVVGGSRGALAVNELVPAAMALIENPEQLDIWHQAGAGKDSATKALYDAEGIPARVDAFVDDMAEAFAWADVVVCRAGALTVSELAAVGLGAILIPFPYAIDDHQTANANYLASQGAAFLRQQSELTSEKLAELLKSFIFDRTKLVDMACKARALAKPCAVKVFADYCEEVAHA
ncbi:MAG: undecaprenyldiphospho-muramoylpentapeptide beta-N-acetylglucosaminyltransferase [Agarilytica sp.]